MVTAEAETIETINELNDNMINGLCKRKTIAMPYDFIKLIDLNAVINQYNSLLIFFCFDYH